MTFTTSLFVPLAKGLDLSKELVAGGDELHQAYNVDFGPDGSIKGRPSRAAADQFYVLDPSTAYASNPTYQAASTFANTAKVANGMLRIRDGSGERPALATEGRLFLHEGSKWHDRGAFACARVDRLANLPDTSVNSSPSTGRRTMTLDFGVADPFYALWALYSSSGALEQRVKGTATPEYAGTGARSGTTTACVTIFTGNFLNFTYRVAGAGSLTSVQLATDAALPTDIGDAPCICPVASGGFYVVYRTTTANQFKVLKVSITGTIAWTYTKATGETGLQGIWVDNTAGGNAVVAFTHGSGLTIRQLNDTTGAISGSDCTETTGQGYDCVVGVESTTGKIWWAYRQGAADEDIIIGWSHATTFATTVMARLRGIHSSTFTNAGLRWSIVHQPVRAGLNAHMYLTLACSHSSGYTATWLTLDLSNWYTTTIQSNYISGPFASPTIVARGPTQATYPHKQPCPAIPLSDSSGFVFPTQDWQRFGVDDLGTLTGTQATCGMNKVSFSKPRAAQLGDTTVFSGSVPRMIARGDCVELGWPFLAGEPGLEAEAVAGGSVPAGTWGVVACWKWVDEAGQIHRSAPSPIRTATTVGGVAQTIRAHIVNPWLTEKSSRVTLELYAGDPATSNYRLQSSTEWSGSSLEPTTTVNVSTLATDTESLYTDGTAGSELANYHVQADGGVAAVGRRLWVAGDTKVFASKLWTAGYGPQFNDEAISDQPTLYVNLPAGAGRVVALENLDDKLVVFCERGVFLVQDGGPNNTGAGADFAPPLRISDLAIAGPCSSCVTDAGVLFCSALDNVDASRGGPWLIDRQFTFTQRQYLGRQAQRFFLGGSSFVPQVAYSPERQQAYITVAAADESSSDGVAVVDFRHEKWAVWDTFSSYYGAVQAVAVVSGVLWVLNNEPAAYSGTPGTDSGRGDYAMSIKTSDLAANGRDALGWSRVRAVSMLQAEDTASHTLTLSATFDRVRTASTSGSITQTTGSEATWPSSRLAPEWRLPIQKCSTIQVQASATPAVARWTAIRLDVAPLPNRAPAKTRS